MPNFERVKWSKGRKEAFRLWFHKELSQTEGDRAQLEEKWSDSIVQWRARVMGDGTADVPFLGAPYSRDTEILTRLGWKKIEDVEIGEYVLTRNDETGESEWAPVQAKPTFFFEEMLHFKSRTVDLMVSPGHTMVLEKPDGTPLRKAAYEIWEKHGYHIPLTSKYQGVDSEKLFGLDPEDVAEFVGWYLAEGSCNNSGSLSVAQTKERGRRSLERLFDRLGFEWNYSSNSYTVYAHTMPQELRDWCCNGKLCHEKNVPKFFYGASPRIIKALLKGMIAGDGNIRHTKNSKRALINYYTTSPELAGDVQALAQLAGMRASITTRGRSGEGGEIDGRKISANKIEHRVGILWRDRAKLKPKHSHEVVEYNDYAFCVTVKNHAVYVRRNGLAAWCGNSDVEMPLTAIHTDPVYADFMQTLHIPSDFWTVTPLRPAMVNFAKPIQEFLRVVEAKDLHMRKVNERVLMDTIILGTGIYKNFILHERKKVRDYNEAGEVEDIPRLEFKTKIEHVPLQDFFIPAYSYDIDPDEPGGAPWVSHRFDLTKGQLRLKSESDTPYLPAYDKKAAEKLEAWVTSILGEDRVEQTSRQEDQYSPFEDFKITLHEVWVRFDIDGDGIEEDIVVTWHQDSMTILRATHNPFLHGKRPFENAKYLPAFGFYGMGAAELDEWAQLASSRLLNSAIDNAFLANTVMLGVPMGANISPDEPIYPGKIWPLGPNERISEIKMGQPYQGVNQLINSFMQWSEMRTGVSELRQGNITGLPSRTPATTVMNVLNEGAKRFDMILGNMREGPLKNLGVRTLQNIIQISKDDPRYIALAMEALGPEDGQKVAEILSGPVHRVEALFGVSVTATSSQTNREAEKQNTMLLAQTMGQLYPQLLQYAQLLAQTSGDPQMVASVAQAAFNGIVELQRRLLESYDIQNPQEYVPHQMGQEQQPPGIPGMPGAGPQPGMLGGLGGTQGAGPFAQGASSILPFLGIGG